MNLKLLLPIVSVSLLFNSDPLEAQVVEDETLSTEVVRESDRNFRVEGGEQRGSSLFHSFREFSVASDGSILFDNASTVQNIISRVTGNSISQIDGLIQNNGTASLFLINPNGIIFGENATLNIGGSFVGTTAESLLFEDGVEFSANLNNAESLLTVSVPLGLQFGSSSRAIINRANFSRANPLDPTGEAQSKLGLIAAPDRTFALIGNGITFDGGAITVPSGNVELGSVAENSFVAVEPFSEGWEVDYSSVSQFQDIKLDGLAAIDASGEGGGSINVVGRNVQILNGSAITSNTLGNLDGKNIEIQATDLVEINGSDLTGTQIDPFLAGFEIFLPFASQVSTNTSGAGNGGNIEIKGQNLQITDGGAIELQTLPTGTGNGGNLAIAIEESVSLTGFRPLLGVGENAVNLIAPEIGLDTAIELNQASEISLASINSGKGGNIDIVAKNLRLENGSLIGTTPFASGNGGNINLTLAESLQITGVSPRTGSVSSLLTANTFGAGDAGDINVMTELLQLEAGGILVSTSDATGNSGDINIKAASIEVGGAGNSGQTPSLVSAETRNSGDGGDIFLETDSLSISDRATLSVRGRSSGVPGNLIVNADSVNISNSASITAATEFQAGGNIELNIKDRLTLRENSLISARAFNNARGGNLSIDAGFIIAFPQENNDILANALFGRGGNITIATEGIFGLEEGNSIPANLTNDIDASSEFGAAGIVSVSFPTISKVEGQLDIGVDEIDVESLFQSTFCQVKGKSRFFATGRSGIPRIPDNTILPEHTWSDWRTIETAEERVGTVAETKTAIAPPKIDLIQGWVIDEDGNVVLTDRPLVVASRKPGLNTPDCNQVKQEAK